jgi:hypothetical protein
VLKTCIQVGTVNTLLGLVHGLAYGIYIDIPNEKNEFLVITRWPAATSCVPPSSPKLPKTSFAIRTRHTRQSAHGSSRRHEPSASRVASERRAQSRPGVPTARASIRRDMPGSHQPPHPRCTYRRTGLFYIINPDYEPIINRLSTGVLVTRC